MAVKFVFFTPEWESAVVRFNLRMREGNAPTEFFLPERSVPLKTGPVHSDQFLAVETGSGQDEVRGGVIILEHPAYLSENPAPGRRTVINLQAPLSEGIVNGKYAMVSIQLIRFALKQCPYAYVVGMGSDSNPLPRLLKASGWDVRPVPFFFRILNARHCLTQLQPLKRKSAMRVAAFAAAYSGLGSLAVAAAHWRSATLSSLSAEEVQGVDESDDRVWTAAEQQVSFGVVRDQSTLPSYLSPRIRRFRVRRKLEVCGWFSLLISPMREHNYFGNLKVATLADSISTDLSLLPAFAALAVSEARSAGCDLIISNQMSQHSQHSLRAAGFRGFASNYLMASSKMLSAAMTDATSLVSRQDGDGLVNLHSSEPGF